jgi:hypothetical protein
MAMSKLQGREEMLRTRAMKTFPLGVTGAAEVLLVVFFGKSRSCPLSGAMNVLDLVVTSCGAQNRGQRGQKPQAYITTIEAPENA